MTSPSRNGAGLLPMSDETRGKALQDRMLAMGLDESKLSRAVGKDRGTIRRAFAGTASETTLRMLETWFDREERKHGLAAAEAPMGALTPRDHVVIRMEEGGTLVVEGPATTPEEVAVLKELARDLIREMNVRKTER